MNTRTQRRLCLTTLAALGIWSGSLSAEQAQVPNAFEFLPGVLAMAADPPPEYKLEMLCQIHAASASGDQGYFSVLSIDADRVFVVAYSPHKLERPWETMTFRGEFVPTGQTSPIDEGTADWAYVFDRDGDGRIDFLAFRVGPLWILPVGVDERDLPDVTEGVMIDFLEANPDKLGQGFWFLADENFDVHHDTLIARTVDNRSGWADGWLIARDADFDRHYETCNSTEAGIDGPGKKCRKTRDGYGVRGHSVAGLNMVPPPGGFPFEAFNVALDSCEYGADRLYAGPLPAWTDYVPVKTDFAAQPETRTRKACYEKRHFESCEYLAGLDDARAQVTLGTMFTQGRGVPRNDAEGVRWLRTAAGAGDAEAEFRLGLAYALGRGADQDAARAAEWYRLAAEQDHAAAQYMLGRALQSGQGVEQDEEEAVAWYQKSASQDFADAQYMLGVCSAQGLVLEQDETVAAEWYRKAAEQGSERGQFNLAFCYWNGKGVPQDQAEAVEWFRQAAAQGFGPAEYHLGLRLLYGEGVPEDKAEGMTWIRRAAHRGVVDAQFTLGGQYMIGEGVPENIVYAFAWFAIAEMNGHPKAGEGRKIIGSIMTRKQREAAKKLVEEVAGD